MPIRLLGIEHFEQVADIPGVSQTMSTRTHEDLPFATLPPPRTRPVLGGVLMAAGLLAIVVSFFAPIALSFVIDSPSIEDAMIDAPLTTLPIIAFSVGALFIGVSLIGVGRRLRIAPAALKLLQQGISPVLFLRSFDDDDLIDPTPPMIPLGDFFPRRYEESFERALRRIGPMIAIGRPGSRLSELGSRRLYVADHAWKAAVEYLRSRAAAVLFIVGSTEGLRWEIETGLAELPRERLLFFFPYAEGRRHRRSTWRRLFRWWSSRIPFSLGAYRRMEADRQSRYREFRERVEGQLGIALPAELNDAQFMDFTPDGQPRFLPTRRPWWVPFAIFFPSARRMVISLPKTLRPFVDKLMRRQ